MDLLSAQTMYKFPVVFRMRIETGVCRNSVRDMRRMLWASLEGKFMKIYMWYITKILNKGSNFGFDRPRIKGI
jgi:hypothetical protein